MYAKLFKDIISRIETDDKETLINEILGEFAFYKDERVGNKIYFIDGSYYDIEIDKAIAMGLLHIGNGVYIPRGYCYTQAGGRRIVAKNVNILLPELVLDPDTEKYKLSFSSNNKEFNYYFDGMDSFIKWLLGNGKKKELSETVKQV